jgi:hypothetical protein
MSHDTITRLEAGQTVKPATAAKVRAALEAACVIFVAENGEGPGARLRKAKAAPVNASDPYTATRVCQQGTR